MYGFGVVLLELLTGLRALDPKRPSGQHNLVDYAKPYLSQRGKLKDIMEARMEGQYSFKAALQAANLALRCIATEPKNRPSMKEVAGILEKIELIKHKPKETITHSPHSPTRRHDHQRTPTRSPPRPRHPGRL